jgi:hypothetical protein
MADRTGIRVNLTLPPELVAVLDRIGAVSGVGRASFIRQMLVDSLPVFDSMARSMEQAQAKNLDAFTTLTKALDEVRAESDQLDLAIKKHRGMVRKKPRA